MAQGAGIRGTLSAAAIAIVILSAWPSGAGAGVDFGSNLVNPPTNNSVCFPACTSWNSSLHPSNVQGSLSAPISGVVVSFTLSTEPTPGEPPKPLHLRVLRPLTLPSDNLWRGFGASSPDVVPSNAGSVQTFPARVAITAGDYIGAEWDTASSASAWAPGVFMATQRFTSTHPPPDGTPFATNTWVAELLLQGRVEPDSDGDGFGDETQDKCPGEAGVTAGCKAKKKCKRKGKKKSAAAKKKKGCKKRRKKRR